MKRYPKYRYGPLRRQRDSAHPNYFPLPVAAARIGLSILMVVSLSGCALWRTGPPVPDLGGVVLTADSLAAITNRRALTLGALKGSGDLIVRAPDFPRGRRLDVSLVARRPAELRVRGRFGMLASVFDFSADADSLRLYLPRDAALAVVPAGGSRSLSLVASDELVQALLPSTLNPREIGGAASFERAPDGYTWTRTTIDSAGVARQRRWTFESSRLRLVRVEAEERREGATTTAIISYAGHQWTGHAWFPTTIRLELPAGKQSLELVFRTFDLNPSLAPDLFQLRPPPRTRRIPPEELNDDFLMEAPSLQ